VSIQDEDGREIARGLTNFPADELDRIRGMNSGRVHEVLGAEASFDEVVHRDNLVVVVQE
jgi:glutamate 5-kinase